jgi:nucleotide-binding universal stress UspA family protein
MKILIPVDGSRYTEMCLKMASFMFNRLDAEYHILHVMPHMSDLDFELMPRDRDVMRDSFMKRAEDLLENAKQYLKSQGINSLSTVLIKGASPANEILEYAEKEKVNLIIVGARGMTEQTRFLLGSELPKIVKYSPCCVFVVKESCMDYCTV